jgi:hypothetical protein
VSKNVYESIKVGLDEALDHVRATNKPMIVASQDSPLPGIPDGMRGFPYDVEIVDIHNGAISFEEYLAAVEAFERRTPWRGHYITEMDNITIPPCGPTWTGFIRGIPKRD